jgi:subfamily B ATP-binding cassette protein MsbA
MIAVVGAISSYCEKYLTTSVAQWVAHDLRRMVYQRIQRLSLAEHGESRTGDLLTRVTSDIDAVQDFITSALLGIVTSLLTLAGMLAVMFYMNWRFTLIGLSVAPVMFSSSTSTRSGSRRPSRFVKKKEGELMSGVAEVLTSIQVVQAFAAEDYEDRRFDWESRQNVAAGLRARSMKAKLSPMVDLLVAVGTCLVLGYGARLVLAGGFTTGQPDHLHLLSRQDLQADERPLEDDQHGVQGHHQLRAHPGAAGHRKPRARHAGRAPRASVQGPARVRSRLVQLRRQAPDPEGRQRTHRAGSGRGDRRSVGHRQDDHRRTHPALLRSPVGADQDRRTDIREFTLKSLRDQVSFVLQDTLLFRGTVWENIAYGKPDAEIRGHGRAAELANAHEFIIKMPLSYATMVGERGVTLSGGQRRRIAIARAIVRNTPS